MTEMGLQMDLHNFDIFTIIHYVILQKKQPKMPIFSDSHGVIPRSHCPTNHITSYLVAYYGMQR